MFYNVKHHAHVLHISAQLLSLTSEDAQEGVAEGLVEERIKDGVDQAADVAQPGYEVDHVYGDEGTAGCTQRQHHVDDEKR